MSLQHHLPDQVVRADPWTLFCAECSRKMRITTATPAQDGRETRTYECACGHGERLNVAIPKLPARQRYRSFPEGAWSTASSYAL
jgi:lysyl-tRNA synthetase class I